MFSSESSGWVREGGAEKHVIYTAAFGGHLFTGRNEVVAKVIFLHLFVILFTGGEGVCLNACWDTTPREQTPPPWEQTPPPWEQTPPPPREQTPPPLGADTIPPGSRLQHTVYEWPVCILLECILVYDLFSQGRGAMAPSAPLDPLLLFDVVDPDLCRFCWIINPFIVQDNIPLGCVCVPPDC